MISVSANSLAAQRTPFSLISVEHFPVIRGNFPVSGKQGI
jgi:hypothetical protein